jgi:hypothetical protein
MIRHHVTGALATARTSDGKVNYYYQGVVLPIGIVQEDIDHLLANGLIAVLPGSEPKAPDKAPEAKVATPTPVAAGKN